MAVNLCGWMVTYCVVDAIHRSVFFVLLAPEPGRYLCVGGGDVCVTYLIYCITQICSCNDAQPIVFRYHVPSPAHGILT